MWLTDEEVKGYYEGFPNEGLWRCAISRAPAAFAEDWLQYQQANRRFADALLQEMEGSQTPILLARLPFALLPKMVKEARPDSGDFGYSVPNPKFLNLPVARSSRRVAANLISFHTQTHCNNFETVDRAVEALTEWDALP